MRWAGVSVARLMVGVALVGFNIAAARTIFLAYGTQWPRTNFAASWLVGGVMMPAVGLQVGLVRLLNTRGPRRLFWTGYLVFGLGVSASFAWAQLTPPAGRTATATMIYPRIPGSAAWAAWECYYAITFQTLARFPRLCQALQIGVDTPVATMILLSSLPQLAIAALGGWMTRLLAALRRRSTGAVD